jgi:hypothetical protein
MSKIHLHDGKSYRMVKRVAEKGDKVLIVNEFSPQLKKWYKNGDVLTCFDHFDGVNRPDFIVPTERTVSRIFDKEYVVLEPLESEATPDINDLLANLANRVHSLEQQIRDTQRNLETFAEQTESNTRDIAFLDERTQPEEIKLESSEPSVFDLAKIKPFKMSELNGKTLSVYSDSDSAEGVTVTTTVAIDVTDGKMYVLESEVIAR